MNLVEAIPIPANGFVFIRILVRYGSHLFHWDERKIARLFAFLQDTSDTIIFIHAEDCCISKVMPHITPVQLKRIIKPENSICNPLTFEGQFSLDCDSDGKGPCLTVHGPSNMLSSKHNLCVDTVFPVNSENLSENLFTILQDAVIANLTAYKNTLFWFLKTEKSVPRCLTAYFFQHEQLLIRVFYPPSRDTECQWRSEIHEELGLPRIPILRRGLAIFPSQSFSRILGPNKENLVSPHLLIPNHNNRQGDLYDGSCSIIRGRYTYKHYLQDGMDDKNWGCAYRSLQTLVSWLLWQGIVSPLRELPSLRCIQETLVRVGDKKESFIGSRQWIGSLEVSFCIQELCGVQCRLLPISRGSEFTLTSATTLAEHFASGGGPVMVGGGQLAHTIVGVDIGSTKTRYLILDPHYTGAPADVAAILGKGWVGWKEETFWKKDVFYNLCLLPPDEAGGV